MAWQKNSIDSPLICKLENKQIFHITVFLSPGKYIFQVKQLKQDKMHLTDWTIFFSKAALDNREFYIDGFSVWGSTIYWTDPPLLSAKHFFYACKWIWLCTRRANVQATQKNQIACSKSNSLIFLNIFNKISYIKIVL